MTPYSWKTALNSGVHIFQMKTPPWYVLTGGPCSGKTTLLDELHKLNYFTVPEVARELLDKLASRGVPAKDVWGAPELQRLILQKKIELEESAPKNKVVFFDRGLPDSIAYFELLGLQTGNIEKISRNRYRKVFFLELLPFRQDSARTESEAMAKKLDKLIFRSYKDLDYEITRVPNAPIKARLKLILSAVNAA